ncbi:MAG: hypothetical protein ACLFU1_08045 [Alphaproteobacteria bacterium]
MSVGTYAQGANGVMFMPRKGEKTLPRLMIRRSNDNDNGAGEQE